MRRVRVPASVPWSMIGGGALALGAALACRTPPATPAGPQLAPADAALAPPPDASGPPLPAPVTEAECGRFVEHILELGMAAQRATKPSEYVPTAEQVDGIRARLIASRPCAELTRPQWECALTATSQDALYRCAQ